MRPLRTFIIVLCFTLSFAHFACADIEGLPPDPRIDVTYAYLDYKVNSMPLAIRNVPQNPHDTQFPANAGPVSQTTYTDRAEVNLGLDFLWTVRTNNLIIKFGPGFDEIIDPTANVGGSIAERNYSNNVGSGDHHHGGELTYVALEERGIIPAYDQFTDAVLNFTPELRAEISGRHILRNVSLGASVSYFAMEAQTGWDHHYDYTTHHNYVLSYHVPVRMWVGLNAANRFHIMLGAQYQAPVSVTTLGKQAGIQVPSFTGFVEVAIRL
jgi:hypothetical protein